MEYPYFQATPQSYQFLGLPPTPAHTASASTSASANSDDYGNSPVRGVPLHIASPMSSHYSYYAQHHSAPASPNPPVYPSQPSYYPQNDHSLSSSIPPACLNRCYSHRILTQKQDAFEQFHQAFDYSQFNDPNANSIPPQAKSLPPQPQQPAFSNAGIQGFDSSMDMNDEGTRRGSNSDDDDNMTPAQSRRKAQNRAAQRAFRERKERHVKDLENKLAKLEKNSAFVVEENERLKLQLQKAATENEILRATSGNADHGSSKSLPNAGPMRYTPKDFYTEVLNGHENKFPSHRIVTSENGEKLFAVGATWDYIIKHPLYARGLVDVGDVSERLKRLAKCDGQGPVFEESQIIRAIEQSVASGSDELL